MKVAGVVVLFQPEVSVWDDIASYIEDIDIGMKLHLANEKIGVLETIATITIMPEMI